MRKLFTISLALSICIFLVVSCKKDVRQESMNTVPQSVADKISRLGFTSTNVAVHEDGYLVEGDIIITQKELDAVPAAQFLRVGSEEQYRTYNLVTTAPRVITVSLASKLPASYGAALDLAIDRYNALGLTLTFQRVSSGADISLVSAGGNYLASAGFPTADGEPYYQVKVNSRAIGSQPTATVASILAHEIGHCIGFRHTDYMNRQYSCGGSPSNEGASTIGAVLVPGTPSGPDPNSWMLACIGSGMDRPFNANDRTALSYLY
jgi:hypothetical protein